VNGDVRGGYYSTSRTDGYRCCGIRWYSKKKEGNDTLGFRLNGVMRGGRHGLDANKVRSGYRSGNYARSYANGYIGFRLSEWCTREYERK